MSPDGAFDDTRVSAASVTADLESTMVDDEARIAVIADALPSPAADSVREVLARESTINAWQAWLAENSAVPANA